MHDHRTWRTLTALTLLLLARATPAQAGAPLANEAGILAECQDSIREAGLRLGERFRRHAGACSMRGAECVIAGQAQEDCCLRAGARCTRDLDRLDSELARFERRIIDRRCAAVPFADLLDPTGLGYAAVLPACDRLVPPVAVADLADLVACLQRLITEDLAHLIATVEVPSGCDGLACMGVEIAGACAGDPASCEGGIRATPTPGPSVTASPTPSSSPTVAATSTGAPTATATTTGTPTPATPTGTPSATATATATATTTPSPSPTLTATSTTTMTPGPSVTTTMTPLPTFTATPSPTVTATVTITVAPTMTPMPTLTATRTATATPTVTPTATRTPTPTPTGPLCGNGITESGEDCDDGNNFNCDACPADCQTEIAACEATTTRHNVSMTVAPDFGGITGADLCLSYPDGTVSLPGTGLVNGRGTFNGFLLVNDSDIAAQLSASTSTVSSVLAIGLSFDLCAGAPAPPPGAFHCQVRSASDDFNQPIPVGMVACTVQ
jgi:cysteine-rich repeat protein